MTATDFDSFSEAWAGAWELTGKSISAPALETAFKLLSGFPLEKILRALEHHALDPSAGMYPPKPADITRYWQQIAGDGHPGAEEAWAMIPRNDRDTVVWTQQMASAFGVAHALLIDCGDQIGARMAFKESYEKYVRDSRAAGLPVRWIVSLGHNKSGREAPIADAVRSGRLKLDHALRICPTPGILALADEREQQKLLTS